MTPIRPRLQIDASTEVINYAKAVAYKRGLSLTEFIMQLLAKEDIELKKLIERDIANRTKPGNPAKPQV